MNVMIDNFRQQFKELIQYIRFLERENRILTKKIEKLKKKNK
jgi:hypothetical protein